MAMASRNIQQAGNSVIELPHHQDGSVDWDTLGNIITGNMLAEVVYASYVDKKHGIHTTESFRADTDWEFTYEVDNIVVLKKKSERTFFLGRGVIEVPVQVISDYIKDVRSSHIWDKLLVEAKYLKVLKETESCTDYIGHRKSESLSELLRHFSFDKCTPHGQVIRDGKIPLALQQPGEDGKYVHSAVSVDDPDYPEKPDVIRVDAKAGCGFVLEPYKGDDSKTLFSYLGNIDLKGLPMIIMSKVLRSHPVNAIKALRNYFNKTQTHQSWLLSSLSFSRFLSNSLSSRRTRDPLPVEHFVNEEEPRT